MELGRVLLDLMSRYDEISFHKTPQGTPCLTMEKGGHIVTLTGDGPDNLDSLMEISPNFIVGIEENDILSKEFRRDVLSCIENKVAEEKAPSLTLDDLADGLVILESRFDTSVSKIFMNPQEFFHIEYPRDGVSLCGASIERRKEIPLGTIFLCGYENEGVIVQCQHGRQEVLKVESKENTRG